MMSHPDIRRLEIEFDERARVERPPRGCHLPFNGTLSPDEQRMLEQFAFAEWEVAHGY